MDNNLNETVRVKADNINFFYGSKKALNGINMDIAAFSGQDVFFGIPAVNEVSPV